MKNIFLNTTAYRDSVTLIWSPLLAYMRLVHKLLLGCSFLKRNVFLLLCLVFCVYLFNEWVLAFLTHWHFFLFCFRCEGSEQEGHAETLLPARKRINTRLRLWELSLFFAKFFVEFSYFAYFFLHALCFRPVNVCYFKHSFVVVTMLFGNTLAILIIFLLNGATVAINTHLWDEQQS